MWEVCGPIEWPRAITILGTDYTVVHEMPRGDELGLFCCKEGKIYLSPQIPDQTRFAVLWHEVMHAILWSMIDHKQDNLTGEQMTSLIGQSIVAVLRDNPCLRCPPQ